MNVYDQLSEPVALIVFFLTLLLPVLIGFLAFLKTRNQSDFFIGGRAMSKVVVALSAVSTGRSSWLILGVSGMAYTLGAGAVWAIAGYIAVEAVQFFTLGNRMRDETQAMESITVLDYFESRFNDNRHLIRITGAVIIGLFITAYVAAQFTAGAKTLSTALDMSFGLSLLVSALMILIYMTLGGFVAVAYNDAVRAVIMLFGLVVLPVAGVISLGGVAALAAVLDELNPALLDPFALGAGALIGFLGIGLGSPGQPHIVARYMSIDASKNLLPAAIIGTVWNVLLGCGAIAIGLVGRAVVPAVSGLPDKDPEMIYLVLTSAYFGPVLYGLLIGGIFAAILSTADSQLLVVASTVVRDLYEKVFAKNHHIGEKKKLGLSRIVLILSAALAIGLALVAQDLVFWLVLFAWGGLGASLGPALILSLYWKRTSRTGVIAGMLTGTVVTIGWKLWLSDTTGVYELIPAFFGALGMIVAVSLLQKR